jgi:hypothetical protein
MPARTSASGAVVENEREHPSVELQSLKSYPALFALPARLGLASNGTVEFTPVYAAAIIDQAVTVSFTAPVIVMLPVEVATPYLSHTNSPSPLPGFVV